MNTSPPLVRASSLSGFKELMQRHGGAPEHLLEQLNLPPNLLDNPDRFILLETKVELLELAARQCQCPSFGLQLGYQHHLSILGPIGLLAQQCETVREAADMFTRYIHHHILAVDIVLEEKEGIAYLGLRFNNIRASESRQANDVSMAFQHKMLGMLCNELPELRSVFLSGPPPQDLQPYTRLFKAPVAFEHSFSALVFDRRYLDQPIQGGSPIIRRIVQSYLDRCDPNDFIGRTRSIIASLLPCGKVQLASVADCLGMAPRTLQHKLAQHGHAFQPLVDEVRIEQVCTYLGENQLSLADITSLVGYTQQSTLSRCFKRVKGLSPAQWRNRHKPYLSDRISTLR